MLNPGDVVLIEFPGARERKYRPVVVISTDLYHHNRPDIIVSEITSQIRKATAPTDYVLKDWQAAGLDIPSAFRVYIYTTLPGMVKRIGKLTPTDWQAVQERLCLVLDTGK